MKKKYRSKKDLPGIEQDTIFEWVQGAGNYYPKTNQRYGLPNWIVEETPDWFELFEEKSVEEQFIERMTNFFHSTIIQQERREKVERTARRFVQRIKDVAGLHIVKVAEPTNYAEEHATLHDALLEINRHAEKANSSFYDRAAEFVLKNYYRKEK